jgi:hypothetical protein
VTDIVSCIVVFVKVRVINRLADRFELFLGLGRHEQLRVALSFPDMGWVLEMAFMRVDLRKETL